MKPKLLTILLLSSLGQHSLRAADVIRANNADNVNLATAWNGGVAPTGLGIATWDAVSTTANATAANLVWGGLNISSAAAAVSLTGNFSLTLDHSTDASTIFHTGSNAFTWGTVAVGGNWNINGAAGSSSSIATGATFSGSGNVTISSTGTKNWSTNATSNGVTNLDFTGKLALRGATVPAVGNVSGNWLALGGGGGAASDVGTAVQTGSFALDTGDSSSCGSLILTQAWSGKFLKLNSLQGTGSIRTDWGISLGTQTRGIELDQATDTTLAGSILVHNGSNQRRNISFVKKGAGILTLTGGLGSSATAAGAPASLNFDIQNGAIQLGDGTTNPVYTNAANWDSASTFVIGSGGMLRFKTAGPFTWSRSITGGSGSIEITTDGDPGDGSVAFTANNAAFTGNINLKAGFLRMGPNLGSGTLTVKEGCILSVGTPSTTGTSQVGALVLEGNTESDFRLATVPDQISIAGALTPPSSGTHIINLLGTVVAGGTVKLIDYQGAPLSPTDFAKFTLGITPAGAATFALVNNVAGTSIDLVITLEDQLWKGSTDGQWDYSTTNWALVSTPASPALYDPEHPSIFDDSAANYAVTIDVSGVSPGSVKIQNSSNDYTFSGGDIFGPSALNKSGAAKATFTQTLAHTGGTTVSNGTLIFTGSNNNSSGGLIISGGAVNIGQGGASGMIGSGAVSIASGSSLVFNLDSSVLLDFKANVKMRNVSGAGDIVLTGGHTLLNYTGSGLGFNEAGSWSQFSGNLTVKGGSEFRTIRNGATAMGTGSLILGDASSSGALAQTEGNWTFTNPIVLLGADNKMINRTSGGVGRAMKLQGVISGSGGLSFLDPAATFTDANKGYILTATNTLSGSLIIPVGAPLRVGGIPGNSDAANPGLFAGSSGTLGTATIANEGSLTFSRLDAHTVSNNISGSGAVRVGIPAAANLGDTSTQIVTYQGSGTWTGLTTVNNGTLVIPTGVTAGAGDILVAAGTLRLNGTAGAALKILTVSSGGVLAGKGSTAADVIVNGTIAPGDGVGTFTTAADLELNSDSIYHWDLTNWSGTIAGSDWDQIAANQILLNAVDGADCVIRIGAAVSGFSETNRIFRIATASSAVVGFDVSAITIDSADFTAATGAFGTWTVQQTGTTLELVYTAGSDPYIAWTTARGLSGAAAAVDADPDHDGLTNLLEFVLATEPNPANPNSQSSKFLPTVAENAGQLIFTYRSADAAAGLTRQVQYGGDLVNWSVASHGVAGVSIVVNDDFYATGVDQVQVTLPASLAVAGKLMARLRIEK